MDNIQNRNHQNPVVKYTRREAIQLLGKGAFGLGVVLALGGSLDYKEELNIDVNKYMDALRKGIAYLESVQGKEGEFPSYWGEKEIFTTWTTPAVLHTLNKLKSLENLMTEAQIESINAMKDRAAAHLMSHMETTKDGYTGVWRFVGKPKPESQYGGLEQFHPLDLDSTCVILEAVLSANPDYSTMISSGLTDYFLSRRDPSGAFYTWIMPKWTHKLFRLEHRDLFEAFPFWMVPKPNDICAGTNANVLFFYASKNEQYKIQSTMDWLNIMIDNMIADKPYHAVYYTPCEFTYFATRAYADGGAKEFLDADQREDLRNFILSRQESDGSWGTETAHALVSLLNLGYDELTTSEKGDVKKGITYLLDGSWYQKPMDTAIGMEATAKYYNAVTDKPVNDIERFLSDLFGFRLPLK